MLNDASLEHTDNVALVPAFAAMCSVTITEADAFGQGAELLVVYVYTPGLIVAGS